MPHSVTSAVLPYVRGVAIARIYGVLTAHHKPPGLRRAVMMAATSPQHIADDLL